MKSLIIYDSWFGNTEKVARAIRDTLDNGVKVVHVEKAKPSLLKEADLLIIGTPTHGGKPSINTQKLLNKLDDDLLKGTSIAVFDTRFDPNRHGAFLKLLTGVIGYAAPKMAKQLEKLGGKIVSSPEGFIVVDKEGPLKDGELKRARKWGKSLS